MPHEPTPNESGPMKRTTAGQKKPLVWLVSGYRAGERSQIIALGEALNETLGWPFEIKDMQHRRSAIRTNLFRGSDLSGIDLQQSSPLTPPWPDVVISAGLRNEPVCRWIKQQSGGNTLIVHIGKPWADTRCFDLVITTPQYRLPEQANVLHNMLTMHRVTAQRLQAASATVDQAEPQAASVGLFVGGNSGPYTFGPQAARRLAEQASALAQSRGAHLLVSTSARTSAQATRALREHISVANDFYSWQANDPANPYFKYLARANELIVTMDSIAMLSEACATNKPLHIFNFDPVLSAEHTAGQTNDFRLGGLLYRWLMRLGPNKLSRDISIVHQQLIEGGYANWLGTTPSLPRPSAPDDVGRAVATLRALLDRRDRA